MPLAEPAAAAREAAGVVPGVERTAQGRRNRPGPGADLRDLPVLRVPHDHAAGIARQALGRSRGNVGALFKDRLAGLVGVGQHRGVDVDDHLVALTGGAGLDRGVEGGLGEQGQGVGLLHLAMAPELSRAKLRAMDPTAIRPPDRASSLRCPGRGRRRTGAALGTSGIMTPVDSLGAPTAAPEEAPWS
jgi:hypothetical protein